MAVEHLFAQQNNTNNAPYSPVKVLAHGCFDPLHAGHIDHLRDAKRRGDWLIVSVTGDAFVGKGAWRPSLTAEQRAAHIRELRFVDEVLINDSPSAVAMIEKVRPNLYVKGGDYAEGSAELDEEIAAVVRCGGHFEMTQTAKMSSSRLLARSAHGDQVGDYLDKCRARKFWPAIEMAFENAHSLKVTFIGETIIDEYRYVSPLGKASKEFVLAVADESCEVFHGGVMAAMKHATSLCDVRYVTQHHAFDGEIRKTRFVGKDFGQKLFEVYSATSVELGYMARRRFAEEVLDAAHISDVCVVFDFGHGLMDDSAVRCLRPAKFVAVNAQSNAGNQGFNSVNRYHDFNYVCVDAPEARLAAQDRDGDLADVLDALKRRLNSPHVIITHGKHGAHFDGGHVPAFAASPRDTMGAGDCFLAITAPLIATGLGDEEAALVGNVAGAMKTEIVGHRSPIDATVLYQSVKSLLK